MPQLTHLSNFDAMFTGLVETVGKIIAVAPAADSTTLHIQAPTIMDGVQVGDSIAVNGCCLTVESATADGFTATAVSETLRKTTLGQLTVGATVNLERAMVLGQRLGGHLVSGHVDGVGTVHAITPHDAGFSMEIEYPAQFRPNLIPVGSICIDGISLTVASLTEPVNNTATFTVAIIPHTQEVTTLRSVEVGKQINLEFDLIGKYALQGNAYRQ